VLCWAGIDLFPAKTKDEKMNGSIIRTIKGRFAEFWWGFQFRKHMDFAGAIVLVSLLLSGCDNSSANSPSGPNGNQQVTGAEVYNADLQNPENSYIYVSSGAGVYSRNSKLKCEDQNEDWFYAYLDQVHMESPVLKVTPEEVEWTIVTESNGKESFTLPRDEIYIEPWVVWTANAYQNEAQVQIFLSTSECERDSGVVFQMTASVSDLSGEALRPIAEPVDLPDDTTVYDYIGFGTYGGNCNEGFGSFLDETSSYFYETITTVGDSLKFMAFEISRRDTSVYMIPLDDPGLNIYQWGEEDYYLAYDYPGCGKTMTTVFILLRVEEED